MRAVVASVNKCFLCGSFVQMVILLVAGISNVLYIKEGRNMGHHGILNVLKCKIWQEIVYVTYDF